MSGSGRAEERGWLVGTELVTQFGRADAATTPAEDQLAVVACDAPALRVIAPAGSGKTRTMVLWAVDRARRLAADGADGRSVLALSFTTRAAAELSARIVAALRREGLDDDLVTVSTFHSFGARVVAEFGWVLGIRSQRNLLADAARRVLMERAFSRITLEADDHDTWFPSLLSAATKLAGGLYEEDAWHEEPSRWQRNRIEALEEQLAASRGTTVAVRTAMAVARRRADLLGAAEAYRDLKAEMGITDYGDLLTDVVRLAELDEVRDALVERHPYVIVDEYQDTNVVQRRLLQRLHKSGKQQLVVVGDRAQAIYGFRGATVSNFTDFETHFDGAETRALRNVYRHGANVVAVAEAVVSKGHDWEARETVTDVADAEITMRVFVDEEQEAEWIVEEIAALAPRVAAGELAWGDVAVLCGRWRELQLIAPRLRRLGIPVDVSTKGQLYDTPTYWDATAPVRLAVDPGDNVAAARLLLGPRYRLSDRDLAAFALEAQRLAAQHGPRRRGHDEDTSVRLIDALCSPTVDTSDEAKATARRFVDDVRRWVRLSHDLTVAEFLRAVWNDLGLDLAIASSPDELQPEAAGVLESLVDLATGFVDVDGAGDLRSFLRLLDLSMDIGEPLEVASPDLADDAVRLLTIYSAKGLEFDHVFVMALNYWVLPGQGVYQPETNEKGVTQLPGGLTERPTVDLTDPKAITAHTSEVSEANDAEYRRLFYVAATRAKKRLALTASHWKRTVAGPPAKHQWATPYLEELGEAGFDVVWPAASEVPDENPLSPVPLISPDRCPPEPLELAVSEGLEAVKQHATGTGDEDALVARIEAAARRIVEREQAPPPPPASFEVTVTDLVTVARDPAELVRRRVLGLPEPPSAARQRGVLVHQWIEERGWALQDGRDPDEVTPPWRAGPGTASATTRAVSAAPIVVDDDHGARSNPDDPPDSVDTDDDADACAAAWLNTPYASLVPVAVEVPVVLTVGGVYVRGTVDAVYEHPDGTWEVVDIKTGPLPDVAQWLQLEAYALALASDGRRLEDCRLTFVSLHDGRCETAPARPEAELRAAIAAALDRFTEIVGATLQ